MMKIFGTIFIRIIMSALWAGIFLLFLFSPRLVRKFEHKKSLTIFTFPLLLDAQQLFLFEQRTGIKLYIHYYENNDELVAKMFSTKRHGYDLIIPSDYAVKTLLGGKGLLQKIDKSKLHFWSRIHKNLLGHYFDPKNDYSIPYQWEIYGIGFYSGAFKKPPEPTWKLVFDSNIGVNNIGMINNAREVAALASLYLFGTVKKLNCKQLRQVQDLLIEQKERVEVYTDMTASYLLTSKTCPAVVCNAGDIWREEAQGLKFLLPKEGSFTAIDSICIPKNSQKKDLVYQLINFLYEDEVMTYHADKYSFWSALTNISVKKSGNMLMQKCLQDFNTFNFFRYVATEKELDNLWVRLKAR